MITFGHRAHQWKSFALSMDNLVKFTMQLINTLGQQGGHTEITGGSRTFVRIVPNVITSIIKISNWQKISND
jgi:hypothetical protein